MSNEIDIYGDLENYNAEQVLKEKSNENQMLQEQYNNSLKMINDLQTEKKELQKKLKNIERSFWSLLETAKIEVHRKDNQIDELRREIDNITFRRYNYGKQSKNDRYTGLGKPEIDNREKLNLRDIKNNSKKDYNKKFDIKDSREGNCSLNKNILNEKPKTVIKNCKLQEKKSEEEKKKKIESDTRSKLLDDTKQIKKKISNSENKSNIEVTNKAETVTKNFNDLLIDEMLNETTSLKIKNSDVNLYEDLENNLYEDKSVRETQYKTATNIFKSVICDLENKKIVDHNNKNYIISSKNIDISFQAPEKMILCEKTETISNFTQEIYEVINEIDKNSNKTVEKKSIKSEENLNSEKNLEDNGKNNIKEQKYMDTEILFNHFDKAEAATTNIIEENKKLESITEIYMENIHVQSDKTDKLDFDLNWKNSTTENCEETNIEKKEINNLNSYTKPEDVSDSIDKNLKNFEGTLKQPNEKSIGQCIDEFEPENNEKQIREAIELKKNLFEEIISENCVKENIIDKNDNLVSEILNISNICSVINENQKIETIKESKEEILNYSINKNKEINLSSENKTETIKNNHKEMFTSNSLTVSTVQKNFDEQITDQTSDIVEELKNENYTIFDTSLSYNIGVNNINIHEKVHDQINENSKDNQKELGVTLYESFSQNKNEPSIIIPENTEEISAPSNNSPNLSNKVYVSKENSNQTRINAEEFKNKSDKILDTSLIENNYDPIITKEIKAFESPSHLYNGEIFDKISNKTEEILLSDQKNKISNKTEETLLNHFDKSEDQTTPFTPRLRLRLSPEDQTTEENKNVFLELEPVKDLKIESNAENDKVIKYHVIEEINKPNSLIENKSKQLHDISKEETKQEISKKNTKINILENIQIAPPNNNLINCQIHDESKTFEDISDAKDVPIFSLRDIKPTVLKPDVNKILPLLHNSVEINKAATDELVKILGKAPKINRTPKKYSFDTVKKSDAISPPLSIETIPVLSKSLDKIQIRNLDFSPNQSETLEATQFLTDNFLISNSERSPLKGILQQLFGDTPKRNDTENEQCILKYNTIPNIKNNFNKLSKKCSNSTSKIPIVKISKELNYKLGRKKQKRIVCSKKDLTNKTSKNNADIKKKQSVKENKKNKNEEKRYTHLNHVTKSNELFENGSKENCPQLNNQSIIDAYLKECNKCRELENEVSKKIFNQNTSLNDKLCNNTSSNKVELISLVERNDLDLSKENGKDCLQKQIDDIFGKFPFNLEYAQTSDCIFDETLNKSSELNNSASSQKKLCTLDKIYEMSIDNDGTPIWNITKRRKRKRKISKSQENSYFENVKKIKTDNLINLPHEGNHNTTNRIIFDEEKENSTNNSLLNSESNVSETCVRTEKLTYIEKNVVKNINSKQNEKQFISSYKIPKLNRTSNNKNAIETTCDRNRELDIISENSTENISSKKHSKLLCNEIMNPLSVDLDLKIEQENLVTDGENLFKKQFKSPKRIEQDINKSSDNDIEQEFLRIFGKSPNVSQTSEPSQIDDSFNNQDNLTEENNTIIKNLISNVNKNHNDELIETCNNTSITSLNSVNDKSFSTSTKTYKMICDENNGTEEIWVIKRRKKKKKIN